MTRPHEVDVIRGGFCFVRRAVFEEAGRWDERYFMFFEDLDYCKRVQEKGLKVYYYPGASIVHYHGASGKQIADQENQWRRLIPSSKIYHGVLKHYFLTAILWLGQKWQKLVK